MDCNVLHSRRVGNFLLTSNAERRYRKSGNAQQKLVSRVLVALAVIRGSGVPLSPLAGAERAG
jgi:hypothetical protein